MLTYADAGSGRDEAAGVEKPDAPRPSDPQRACLLLPALRVVKRDKRLVQRQSKADRLRVLDRPAARSPGGGLRA